MTVRCPPSNDLRPRGKGKDTRPQAILPARLTADVHTPEQRSRNMAAIRGKDTQPELAVRSLVHAMGFRYRLHARQLPGRPDLVFPSLQKAIFVHGCFWHCHRCRWGRVVPRTNADFWHTKRSSNVSRDRRNRAQLRRKGWKILTIWECQTRSNAALSARLRRFLST